MGLKTLEPSSRLVLVLALVPLGASSAFAGSLGVGVAEFHHQSGWDASGHIDATCRLIGLQFREETPIALTLNASQARLTVFETRINMTLVHGPLPARYDTGQTQRAQVHDVPQGPLQIEWPRQGRGLAWVPANRTATLAWSSAHASLGSPDDATPTGIDYYVMLRGALVRNFYDIPGLGRLLRAGEASYDVQGGWVLAMDTATLTQGPHWRVQLPRYARIEPQTSTPLMTQQSVVLTHAILELSGVDLSFPSSVADPVCADLDARVTGTTTFHDAEGRVGQGEASKAFAQRELTLNGTFRLAETLQQPSDRTNRFSGSPVGGFAAARAEGTFAAVGLDFAVVPPGGSEAWQVAAGVGLLAALIAGASWLIAQSGRLVGFFFTRLAPERILDHPTRFTILGLVANRPGLILRDLVGVTGRPYGVVRHHAGVLVAGGRVKLLRRGSALHLYPADYSLVAARQRLTLEEDEPVRFVVDRLREGNVPRRDLVREVRAVLGLSKMGAWKAVRRAEVLGLVGRTDASGGEVLRLATP